MASFRNEKTFAYFNFLFTLGGVPIYNRPKSFLYVVYIIIVQFSSYSTALAIFMKLYVQFEHLESVADPIITLPGIVMSSFILLYMRIRRDNMQKLLELTDSFTWEDLPTKDAVNGNTCMVAWIPRIQTTGRWMLNFALTFHTVQTVIRMIVSDDKPLSIDAWYPYDATKSPAYELTMVVQFIGGLSYAGYIYSIPPFYATLICIACSQLEKLRIELSNIKQVHSSCRDTPLQHTEKIFTQMQEQLNECIRLHQEIIRFVNELEEVFSPFFVGIFLILMISLCLSTFSALLRWGNPVAVSQSVVAYTVYLVIVIFFCWFASELTEQSDRVREAAWNCDWIGAPISFQRAILFIIACANKEIMLTAGKCVPVSKQTMMNMLKQSFSLFTFLLQVRENDDKEG